MEGDEVLGELDALKRGLDSPGPALPLSPEREQAMLDAALAQQGTPLARTRSARPAVVLALVAVGAAAALGVLSLTSSDAGPPSEPARPGAPASAQPSVTSTPGSGQSPPSAPAEPSAALVPAPAEPAAPPSRAAASPSTDVAREVDLLKQANDLRRTGDFAGAEKLYRQVIARYPQTTSAYVAMSSVASLIMARDPAAAVEMYRAARRAHPSGTLDLEIRQGLARAYRKQGQTGAERRELEELIARYPSAEASERARARLAELGAAPR